MAATQFGTLRSKSGSPSSSSGIHGFCIYTYFYYEKISAGKTRITWTFQGGYDQYGSYPATNTYAYSYITLSFSAVNGTLSDIIGNSIGSTKTYHKNWPTLGSGSMILNHKEDGTGGFSVSADVSIGGWEADNSTSFNSVVTNYPYPVKITNYPSSFNDEQNPVITLQNNVGTEVTKVEAAIKSSSGNEVPYRTLSSYTGNYTFTLSSAEKTNLYNATKNTKTLSMNFYLRQTMSDGLVIEQTYPTTLQITNANPTLSPSVTDGNSTTKTLTGSSSKFILGYSSAVVTFGQSLKKSATLASMTMKNSANVVLLSKNGTVSPIKDSTLKFTIVDSRGNSGTATKTLSTVAYTTPTVKITSTARASNTSITVNLSGTGKYGSFGSKNNTYTIKYRYKTASGSYSSWTAISALTNFTPTAAYTKSFSFTVSNAYLDHYIQLQVTDSLASATSNEYLHSTGQEPKLIVRNNANSTTYNLQIIRGTVPGTSSYDQAKSAGYTGTKAQFTSRITKLDAPPVGTLCYTTGASPASIYGGTWTQIKDKFVYASGAKSLNATGGSSTHALTTAETPGHWHGYYYANANAAWQSYWTPWVTTSRVLDRWGLLETGGGQAHNNMPPYYGAALWQRTA